MATSPIRALLALPGSSVTNARRAAGELASAVADRVVLTRSLEPDGAEGGWGILGAEECWQVLKAQSFGRLAYVARERTPDICPVNYLVHQGAVLVASGPGPKLQAAERGDPVAFEVDDVDVQTRTGRSVVVRGKARKLSEDEVAKLGVHVPSPWAAGPRRHVIRISPTRVSGRVLA